MKDNIVSDFRVASNKVINFEFSQKEIKHDNNKTNVSIDFNVGFENVIISEEKDEFLGSIDLIIQLKGVEENTAVEVFKILVKLNGKFAAIKETLSKNKFEEMVRLNGIVVMMHQGRSFITSTTALAGIYPPIIIPMVNVYELNKATILNTGNEL